MNKISLNITIAVICISFVPVMLFYGKFMSHKYFIEAEDHRAKGELDKALLAYEKAYKIPPLNRDVVHGYVGGLNYFNKNDEAYKVINNYFEKMPKDSYWDDIDMWLDKGIAELGTKRCSDAGASAWHVLMRTTQESKENELAGAIMSKTLSTTDCMVINNN